MRNLSIKKLAAIATGAALVGTALVPFASAAVTDLQKSELIGSSGQPIADIVVGANAAVSDVIWAGNIAATLATKANTTASVTCSGGTCAGATPSVEGLTVDFSVGGTTTVTGGKTFFSDMNSSTNATLSQESNFNDQNVTNSSIPSLKYYGSKSYTWNGSASYSITMQEVLGFTADVIFDDVTAKALITEISSNGLKYEVALGSGIPTHESSTVTTKFSDDANDNVRIPFFGTDYLVNSVDQPNGYIELLESAGELTYNEGDTIDGLIGKDGGNYYVEVGPGGVVGSTNKVFLTLYKEDGTQVGSDYYATGSATFYDSSGEEVLSTLVYIKQIVKRTESDADVYTPSILVGNSRLEIYDSKGFPYDSTKTDDEYTWNTSLVFSSDNNYLQYIRIKNKSNNDWMGTEALTPGDEAAYINDYGTLKFLGLQLPEFTSNGVSRTQRTTAITIKDGQITYKDNTYESQHTLDFYKLINSVGDEDTGTFSIDGQTIWYKINLNDVNVMRSESASGTIASGRATCIGDGNYINGEVFNLTDVNNFGGIVDANVGDTNIDINGMRFTYSGFLAAGACVYLTADGNVTFKKNSSSGTLIQEFWYVDTNVAWEAPISFEGTDNVTADYVVMVYEYSAGSKARIFLMLDSKAYTTQYSKTWQLVGTDTAETMDINRSYYVPKSSYLPTDNNWQGTYNANDYYVAWFYIEDNDEGPTAYDFNFFVDTATGEALNNPASNTNLSNYTFEGRYIEDLGTTLWTLSEDPTNSTSAVSEAYSDFGSKFTLSNHELTAVLPENRPQAELLISGTGTTTTVTGGEEFTGVKEGEAKTTTDGTTVTITNIAYESAACTGGEGGEVVCTPSVSTATVPVSSLSSFLVKADSEAGVGTHIIVGGWKANTLANNVVLENGENIKEALAKSGDFVYDRTTNGNFIVAGYTKGDTVKAAKAFINVLEGL